MATGAQARPGDLSRLTASEVAAGLASGGFTSEDVVTDCLARIESDDPILGAWCHVDRDHALAQARSRDDQKSPRGLLHGIPVGVKDVLDTFDMPTTYGSSIYEGHRPHQDSHCVASLRSAGAVILGKTTTTEFASPVPVGVRNPYDTARSPGVSSSGSAAAVASFMTPLANGTQTGGSVILPAAFCGVVGYKASLDGLDRTGIRSLKAGLDTLGYFARSIEDIGLVWQALTARSLPPELPPVRIGICRTAAWNEAEPAAQQAVETAAQALTVAGFEVSDVELPSEFREIEQVFRVISGYEGKRALAEEFRDHMNILNSWLQDTGRSSWSDHDYENACRMAAAARKVLGTIFDRTPLLMTPSTVGEAPVDLTGISNSSFNRIWTLMHGPCITLPVMKGPAGMPIGIQFVARQGADDALIRHITAIASHLNVTFDPPGTP